MHQSFQNHAKSVQKSAFPSSRLKSSMGSVRIWKSPRGTGALGETCGLGSGSWGGTKRPFWECSSGMSLRTRTRLKRSSPGCQDVSRSHCSYIVPVLFHGGNRAGCCPFLSVRLPCAGLLCVCMCVTAFRGSHYFVKDGKTDNPETRHKALVDLIRKGQSTANGRT